VIGTFVCIEAKRSVQITTIITHKKEHKRILRMQAK
jgi:hypothetical protein